MAVYIKVRILQTLKQKRFRKAKIIRTNLFVLT